MNPWRPQASNAERLQIDPDRFGAMGGSVGGNLSAMLAATCTSTPPVHTSCMSTFDLANATLLYGSIAYFAYDIPALSQALIIAILSLL